MAGPALRMVKSVDPGTLREGSRFLLTAATPTLFYSPPMKILHAPDARRPASTPARSRLGAPVR